jgi:hypothetical protein
VPTAEAAAEAADDDGSSTAGSGAIACTVMCIANAQAPSACGSGVSSSNSK